MFGLNEAMMSFIKRQVGLRTDTASASGSLHGKIKDVRNNLGIKSVQRGVATLSPPGDLGPCDPLNVAISPVNLNKSFSLCSGDGFAIYEPSGDNLRAQLINATTLRIIPPGTVYNQLTVAWQVIEFY